MDFDKHLIKNVIEEINRLKDQLADLEKFADELSVEERESIKKETFEQLINNTKILEKMKSGDLKCSTEIEDAKKVNKKIYLIYLET
jgi:hypothetical protein